MWVLKKIWVAASQKIWRMVMNQTNGKKKYTMTNNANCETTWTEQRTRTQNEWKWNEKTQSSNMYTLLTHIICEMQAKNVVVVVVPNQDGIHLALNGKWIYIVHVCVCVYSLRPPKKNTSFITTHRHVCVCMYFWAKRTKKIKTEYYYELCTVSHRTMSHLIHLKIE